MNFIFIVETSRIYATYLIRYIINNLCIVYLFIIFFLLKNMYFTILIYNIDKYSSNILTKLFFYLLSDLPIDFPYYNRWAADVSKTFCRFFNYPYAFVNCRVLLVCVWFHENEISLVERARLNVLLGSSKSCTLVDKKKKR